MSGGSYDYFYSRLEAIADQFCDQKPALRRAFGRHLKLVAEAMHDIEWVDSSDYGPGDEVKAIEKVLGASAAVASLPVLLEEAEKLIKELQVAVKKSNQKIRS